MNRRHVLVLGKVLVSLSILGVLVARAELDEIARAAAGVSWPWLLAAYSMHLVGFWVSALRWQVLLAARGHDLPVASLLDSIFVGTFFNQFLPTTFGGDAMRAYDASRWTATSYARQALIVIVDRLCGLVSMAAIAAVALVAGGGVFEGIAFWLGPAMLAGVAAIAALILAPRRFARLASPWLPGAVAAKVETMAAALEEFGRRRGALAIGVGLSLVLHANVIAHYAVVAHALGLEVPLWGWALVVPVVQTLVQAPITVNGIGYREGLFVLFLARLGVEAPAAIAVSLLAFVGTLALGLVGGLVFALRPDRAETYARLTENGADG